MAFSALAAAGVIGVFLVVVGVLNVYLLIPFVILGFGPLAVVIVARMFRHAAPSANAGSGPSVPSTREASYDPVADPGER